MREIRKLQIEGIEKEQVLNSDNSSINADYRSIIIGDRRLVDIKGHSSVSCSFAD